MNNLQISVLARCLDSQQTFAQLAKHFNISIDELVEHVLDQELQAFLCSDTSYDDISDFRVWANNAGITFIEQHRKDSFRFWLPVWISVAALVVAILALGVSIWR